MPRLVEGSSMACFGVSLLHVRFNGGVCYVCNVETHDEGWLLKAHVEASFFSSIILASVILKLGRYGLLRIIYIIKFIFNKFYINLIIINLYGILILRIICFVSIRYKINYCYFFYCSYKNYVIMNVINNKIKIVYNI